MVVLVLTTWPLQVAAPPVYVNWAPAAIPLPRVIMSSARSTVFRWMVRCDGGGGMSPC